MHRAVDKVDLNVIWPSDDAQQTVLAAAPKIQFKKQDIALYDKRIIDNPEQLDAVFHAVNRVAQPLYAPRSDRCLPFTPVYLH